MPQITKLGNVFKIWFSVKKEWAGNCQTSLWLCKLALLLDSSLLCCLLAVFSFLFRCFMSFSWDLVCSSHWDLCDLNSLWNSAGNAGYKGFSAVTVHIATAAPRDFSGFTRPKWPGHSSWIRDVLLFSESTTDVNKRWYSAAGKWSNNWI